ncbi:MAG TPA: hypothetical protein VIJ75_11690 [Hanamia sp.]
MKKIGLCVFVWTALSACKKEVQDNQFVGKWQLTASLADPGDGSGRWQSADPTNPQYIEFRADSTLAYYPSGPYNSFRFEVTSDSTMIFSNGFVDFLMRYNFSERF